MRTSRWLAASFGLAIPFVIVAVGAGASGCKPKDEPPPPLPAAPQETAPPPATVNLAPPPDDGGEEGGDADADAKVGYGKPPDLTGLRACCAALQANAASMPPPQNMYASSAASYCQAMVNSVNTPGQKDAMLAGIRNALRGIAIPAACH